MQSRFLAIIFAGLLCVCSIANAQDSTVKTKSVRMGCGMMTFDTVPGWGLRPDGKSTLGPTHGGVVVDCEGNVYTSAQAGVFVFSSDGKVVHSYLGPEYSNIHDMEIREEEGGEQERRDHAADRGDTGRPCPSNVSSRPSDQGQPAAGRSRFERCRRA